MAPPHFSEYLVENIAGSKIQVIEDAGHMVMLERPRRVAEALEGFLSRIPYSPVY